jgi:hypothetical protein
VDGGTSRHGLATGGEQSPFNNIVQCGDNAFTEKKRVKNLVHNNICPCWNIRSEANPHVARVFPNNRNLLRATICLDNLGIRRASRCEPILTAQIRRCGNANARICSVKYPSCSSFQGRIAFDGKHVFGPCTHREDRQDSTSCPYVNHEIFLFNYSLDAMAISLPRMRTQIPHPTSYQSATRAEGIA